MWLQSIRIGSSLLNGNWLYFEGVITDIYGDPISGRGELLPTVPEGFGFLGSNVKLPQKYTAFLLADTNRVSRSSTSVVHDGYSLHLESSGLWVSSSEML